MTIGETISRLRKDEHMTVQTLSILSGLSETFINKIQADKKKPSYNSLTKIADVCNRDMQIKYKSKKKITSVYFEIPDEDRAKEFDEEIAELRDKLFGHCFITLCNFDKEKTEDLVQETMYKALIYSHRYNADSCQLYTWLFKIARNTHLNNERDSKYFEAIEDYIDLEIEPETIEFKPIIKAIDKLPKRAKQLFKLKTLGYTYKEIGEIMGTKGISAKSKYFTIRKKLVSLV